VTRSVRPGEREALADLAEERGSTVGVYVREVLRRHLRRTDATS
jgi:hypothetical protein